MKYDKLILSIIISLLSIQLIYAQSTKIHVVKANETAFRISRKYNISLSKLYEYNPGAKDQINVGQKLIIPVSQESKDINPQSDKAKELYHAVEKGETLYSIARQYKVSVEDILKANPKIEKVENLKIGLILKIPGDVPTTQEELELGGKTTLNDNGIKGLKIYTVSSGQTIYSLLKETGWSEEELFKYNPILKRGLFAGQNIFVPDHSLANNTILSESEPQRDIVNNYPTLNIGLALPFNDATHEGTNKYVEFYEGCLIALKYFQQSGGNVNLYVVDSSKDNLPQSIRTLKNTEKLDVIIGGVSENSVKSLLTLAAYKRSNYIIPFSPIYVDAFKTDGVYLYQVNPPKYESSRIVIRRIIKSNKRRKIYLYKSPNGNNEKTDFLGALKEESTAMKKTLGHYNPTDSISSNDLFTLSANEGSLLIIPTTGDKATAIELLNAVSNANKQGADIKVVGHPEWQTFESAVMPFMEEAQATFYTMFYLDYNSPSYKQFSKDFYYWFSSKLANIYPRYGILGYDIMNYYLTNNAKLNFKMMNQSPPNVNIQSKLNFTPTISNKHILFNSGIMFVTFKQGKIIVL